MSSLKVGIVGAGGISRVHAAGWRELGADVMVHSVAGAEALADEFGFTVAEDLDVLLGAVDVVDIAAPSSVHRDIALAAIAAGRNVVCEKPLAHSFADAQQIASAALSAGVQIYPAHVVRFFPEYARVKQQVDAGRVGEVAVLRFTRGGSAPRPGSWFYSERDGGGIVPDLMIHDLDQAMWLAGDVVQVYAVQNPLSRDGIVPPAVTAQAVLTHSSGAISHIQGMWGAVGLSFNTSMDVAGSDGFLTADTRTDGSVLIEAPGLTDVDGYLPPQTHAESPYTAELREFAAAFAGGQEPRVSALDGVKAVAVAEAATLSIATGQAVDIDTSTIVIELENAGPIA